MSDFLKKILNSTRQDLEVRKEKVPVAVVVKAASLRPHDRQGIFRSAITAPGISLIAEVKRASPSQGDIRPELSVSDIVTDYDKAGARVISVLTEERYFHGSLADLVEARQATSLPILRKDFIIDEYQILEAAAAGGDAVLLIVAALELPQLKSLMHAAEDAGLEPLVEVHNRAELDAALEAGASIVGINNRDLTSFEVTLDTSLDMIEFLPEELLVVSESGIKSREDVIRLEGAGVDAVLVGETLMRSSNPGDKIRELLSR